MSEYVVTRKSDGAEVYRYQSDAPVEWNGMEFSTHDHTLLPVADPDPSSPVDPSRWKIDIGSFLDRFGQQRIAILADPDPIIQAFFKDILARKYIDLIGRRAELADGIAYINGKSHAVDPVAVLDVEPSDEEVWRG